MPYWRLSSFYFFYFALLGGTAPFLALYFDHLGFSAARIGELVAIPMLMRCLAPNLWGWLGDRSGQRLLIVRLGAMFTLVTFCGIFLSQRYGWLALIMALHAFFWHAVLPQFEVITLGHLRDQAARYSQIRLWGSIGFICTVVGLGALFDRVSLDAYPVALASIMLGIVLASLWVPGVRLEAGARTASKGGFWRELARPGMIAFYVCVALMQLSNGPYYTFLSLHLESYGYDRIAIGLLWALGVVAEIILFLGMSRLLKRFSLRQVLIAAFAITAVRWLLLGNLAGHWPVLLVAQCMHAATFGAFHAGCIHFVQRYFSAHNQGQAQALYVSASGVGGAVGALYAGYSWSTLGAATTFALATLVALLATAVIFLRLPNDRPQLSSVQ